MSTFVGPISGWTSLLSTFVAFSGTSGPGSIVTSIANLTTRILTNYHNSYNCQHELLELCAVQSTSELGAAKLVELQGAQLGWELGSSSSAGEHEMQQLPLQELHMRTSAIYSFDLTLPVGITNSSLQTDMRSSSSAGEMQQLPLQELHMRTSAIYSFDLTLPAGITNSSLQTDMH